MVRLTVTMQGGWYSKAGQSGTGAVSEALSTLRETLAAISGASQITSFIQREDQKVPFPRQRSAPWLNPSKKPDWLLFCHRNL